MSCSTRTGRHSGDRCLCLRAQLIQRALRRDLAVACPLKGVGTGEGGPLHSGGSLAPLVRVNPDSKQRYEIGRSRMVMMRSDSVLAPSCMAGL